MPLKAQLPRLSREWYQGEAFVFWTYTIKDRKTGWLTASFHSAFREVLLQTLFRYRLAAPVYCLMPDHLHWIGIGFDRASDQLEATSFLRKFLSSHLKHAQWQRQAYSRPPELDAFRPKSNVFPGNSSWSGIFDFQFSESL